MHLEDHVGDILRKARTALGVSATTVAQQANLAPEEYARLEEDGRIPGKFPYETVAGMLELDARKLSAIANGWLPAPQSLTPWQHLHMITTSQAGNSVNAFLVWDATSREAALFDTGWTAAPIMAILKQHSLLLKHICITHSHQDHIAGMAPLTTQYPSAIIHRGFSTSRILLGSLQISTHPVPGHAVDGVVYRIDHWPGQAPGTVFLGDTLFAGSLARGFISTAELKQAAAREILSLPGNTLLCPGHGPVTTVDEEKNHNPFFTHRQ